MEIPGTKRADRKGGSKVTMGVMKPASRGKKRKSAEPFARSAANPQGRCSANKPLSRDSSDSNQGTDIAAKTPRIDMADPAAAYTARRTKNRGVDLFCYEEMDDSFVGFKSRSAPSSQNTASTHYSQPSADTHPSSSSSAFAHSAGATVKKGFLSSCGDLSEAGARLAAAGRLSQLPRDDLDAVVSKLSFTGGSSIVRAAASKDKLPVHGNAPKARYPMDWSLKKSARITSSGALCSCMCLCVCARAKCMFICVCLGVSIPIVLSHTSVAFQLPPTQSYQADSLDFHTFPTHHTAPLPHKLPRISRLQLL